MPRGPTSNAHAAAGKPYGQKRNAAGLKLSSFPASPCRRFCRSARPYRGRRGSAHDLARRHKAQAKGRNGAGMKGTPWRMSAGGGSVLVRLSRWTLAGPHLHVSKFAEKVSRFFLRLWRSDKPLAYRLPVPLLGNDKIARPRLRLLGRVTMVALRGSNPSGSQRGRGADGRRED